ncbi:diacylglycerol kinase family protein [Ferruginibacter sp.]
MKIFKSFAFAFNGIKICFTSETNFKIHVVLAAVAILMGMVFNISTTEWGVIFLCIAFVISMEMINTAIEKLCDEVTKDIHPVIKKVKDIAAGAVLVAAGSSFVIGSIIFLPKIIIYIKTL